jgi:hypothetical protein
MGTDIPKIIRAAIVIAVTGGSLYGGALLTGRWLNAEAARRNEILRLQADDAMVRAANTQVAADSETQRALIAERHKMLAGRERVEAESAVLRFIEQLAQIGGVTIQSMQIRGGVPDGIRDGVEEIGVDLAVAADVASTVEFLRLLENSVKSSIQELRIAPMPSNQTAGESFALSTVGKFVFFVRVGTP